MTHQQAFISYAREQFYFVESLALSLQSYGITVWFDVEQIYPGSDWEKCIDEGLAASTAFVLVVSQASLKSKNVEKEVSYAIKTGKPIYAILFENIPLPWQLQDTIVKDAIIIDMRGDFEQQATLLARLLHTKQRHYVREKAGRLYPQFPFSPDLLIGCMWLAALLNLIGLSIISAVFIMKITSLPSLIGSGNSIDNINRADFFSALTIIVNWAFFAGYLLLFPWQFTLRKRFNIRLYWFSIYIVPIDTTALQIFNLEFFHRVLPPDAANMLRAEYLSIDNGWALGFIAFGSTLGFLSMFLLRKRSALHWLCTGSAPDGLRLLVNKKWQLPWQVTPIPTPNKTYHIYYHPDDEHIANDVWQALEKNPHLRRATDQHIDYHIAILTSKVSVTAFNNMLNAAQHLVCVIGTNIKLPKEMGSLLRLQWIDYRKREPIQLQSLANLLHYGAAYSKGYTFSTLPEDLQRKVLPEGLYLLSLAFRLVAALSLSISIFLLFSTGPFILLTGVVLIALLAGLYLFHNADKLEVYNLSHRLLALNYGIILICTVTFDIFGIFVVSDSSLDSFLAFLFSGISLYLFVGFATFILFMFFFNRKTLVSKRFINLLLLFFMSSIVVNLCDIFSAQDPSSRTPWLYDVEPSTLIAAVFTAFLLALPFVSSFSLTRIFSLLPNQTSQTIKKPASLKHMLSLLFTQISQSANKVAAPTLAVPPGPWLTRITDTRLTRTADTWLSRIVYLTLALEIALLFLTQFYS
jgi:hypothetical protein